VRVWIDIENPPQVRYLLPCKAAFERAGADVLVTARDDGATYELLESERVDFEAVGRQPGRSRRHKVTGLLRRARALTGVAKERRADVLLSASRPAAVAARYLGLPNFSIGDYEHANLTVQRATRVQLLFPDVIDPGAWGMKGDRLIPFHGLKEDLSFSGIELDDFPPHRFDGVPEGVPLVLFRPPAEESHYHREASATLTRELLAHLAGCESAQVVFSPRYEYQASALEHFDWLRPPIVLHHPVHFVSLIQGVDLVVSSGGTMLREAAYLGVPAYSIYLGAVGGVDRYLESIGRLRFVASSRDFGSIELEKGRRQPVLRQNPHLAEEVVAEITSRAGARANGARR
jgi:predicted glycosyltransferase